MVLEQVFECPRTLAKLRSGPLGKLLEGFCRWLLSNGFSHGSIRTHLANLSHLNEHLDTARAPIRERLSARDVEGFLRAYPSWCRHRGSKEEHLRRVGYSVHRFTGYLREQGLFDADTHVPIYQPVLEAYLEWMRSHQHASEGTLVRRAYSIRQFLQWLGAVTVLNLAALSADTVERFFVAYAKTMGRSARRSMQSALRTFLRFCLHAGYLQQPLDRAVPTLRTYKLATVPRSLSDDQAQQVLRGINRRCPVGRRDYAIIQMLYTYGVRGGQLRTLRMEDIDWAQNGILFKAAKHGKDTRLPLTPETGRGLLAYLRNGRPVCACPEVFVTSRAPHRPLTHSNALSAIVERHIRATGIVVHSRGAHVFRHGFATRMLQQGHSLKAIADVLGHRHLTTTFIYTKVDFNALQQVALDWPQEVSV